MKNSIITELVKFSLLETATNEQLMLKAENLVDFQKKHDGFIDSEMVKNIEEDQWYFIYHYENMEKVMAIGKKLKESQSFKEFMHLIDPESLNISFYNQLNKW